MPKDLFFYDAVVNLWCLYNVDTQYIIMLKKLKNQIKQIKGRWDKWRE